MIRKGDILSQKLAPGLNMDCAIRESNSTSQLYVTCLPYIGAYSSPAAGEVKDREKRKKKR